MGQIPREPVESSRCSLQESRGSLLLLLREHIGKSLSGPQTMKSWDRYRENQLSWTLSTEFMWTIDWVLKAMTMACVSDQSTKSSCCGRQKKDAIRKPMHMLLNSSTRKAAGYRGLTPHFYFQF